jgi:hypothetical protein
MREPEREQHERRHELGAGDRRNGFHAGQVPLEVPGRDRVSECGRHDHEAAEQGVGPAIGVNAEQHRHADDPDRDAHEAGRVRALLAGEGEGEEVGEDRRARDEDPRERRGDVLLPKRDQAERTRDLHEGEDDDGAEAPAKAPQDITVKRQGHQHERRKRGARGDDRPRRHTVVQPDLDEEV